MLTAIDDFGCWQVLGLECLEASRFIKEWLLSEVDISVNSFRDCTKGNHIISIKGVNNSTVSCYLCVNTLSNDLPCRCIYCEADYISGAGIIGCPAISNAYDPPTGCR